MDPITGLQLSAQRRAEFERLATEHRLARSVRPRRTWRTFPRQPRPATVTAPLACCPA